MRITKSCYCALGLAHSDAFFVNAGFICGIGETVVIDSSYTSYSAKAVLGYAQVAAPENYISYLINTEMHYDHTFGNSVFKEVGAKIVGHKDNKVTIENIQGSIKRLRDHMTIEARKLNNEAELFHKGIQPTKTDILIDKDIQLSFGNKKLEIITTPGHTKSNISVFFPEDEIIYVGDTIYAGFLPTLRFGGINLWQQWLDSLDKIENLEVKILVPGHGDICMGEEISLELGRHRKIIEKAIEKHQ